MAVRDEMAAGRELLAAALRLNIRSQVAEIDLMTRGLAGLAMLHGGDIESGLRRLDEAMATAVASQRYRPEAVGFVSDYVLAACEAVRDFERARQWLAYAHAADNALGIAHFASFRRSHDAAVLTWRGRYDEAEQAVESMRAELSSIAPGWVGLCDVRLAEIRRRQGRTDEARRLLQAHTSLAPALLTLASVSLDTGHPDDALSLAERYLRRIGSDQARRLPALDIVMRAAALAGAGKPDRARTTDAIREIRELAPRIQTRIARAILAEAAALDPSEAPAVRISRMEEAIDEYELADAPYEAAAARLQLAAILEECGSADRAVRERETARTAATTLGAAGLLRRAGDSSPSLGNPTSPASAGPIARHDTGLSTRELEVLRLVAQGLSNHDIGERLFVSPFTVKRHVANILTKLDLPTRAAAASYAVREGLTEGL